VAIASSLLALSSASAVERRARWLLAPIEMPSANKFAKPRIKMIERERSAPTTPETTARVVTMPSFAP
jgi:hypothetical protein